MYNFLPFLNHRFNVTLFFSLLFFTFGCNKEDNCDNDTQAKLIVSPEQLDIKASGYASIFLSTQPATTTTWQIASNTDWLSFEPSQGEINQDIVEIKVSVIQNNCETGNNQDWIQILTNSIGGQQLRIDYYLNFNYSGLGASIEKLTIDFYENSGNFYLKNSGHTDVDWEISAHDPFLSPSPSDGFLTKGDSALITVTANRDDLPANIYNTSMVFTSQINDTFIFPVTLNHYFEEKTILSSNVVAAEYDRTNDKIIALTSSPPGVNIIDPNASSETIVPLEQIPICMSIAPMGGKVLVGCENDLYLIDTESASQLQHIETGVYPKDIILGTNDWVYVYHNDDHNNYLSSINIITGETTQVEVDWDIQKLVAHLHPSNNYIYSLHITGSSHDVFKFSIENDTATYENDWWNMDYSFHHNFWISDDGLMIFTYGNTIARSSENQAYDLEYITKFDKYDYVIWLDTHSESNKICSIHNEGDYSNSWGKKLTFYNYDNFQQYDTVSLPYFFIDKDTTGVVYNSEGQYVFFSKNGEKIHVLLKAEEEYPIENDWAYFTHGVPEK